MLDYTNDFDSFYENILLGKSALSPCPKKYHLFWGRVPATISNKVIRLEKLEIQPTHKPLPNLKLVYTGHPFREQRAAKTLWPYTITAEHYLEFRGFFQCEKIPPTSFQILDEKYHHVLGSNSSFVNGAKVSKHFRCSIAKNQFAPILDDQQIIPNSAIYVHPFSPIYDNVFFLETDIIEIISNYQSIFRTDGLRLEITQDTHLIPFTRSKSENGTVLSINDFVVSNQDIFNQENHENYRTNETETTNSNLVSVSVSAPSEDSLYGTAAIARPEDKEINLRTKNSLLCMICGYKNYLAGGEARKFRNPTELNRICIENYEEIPGIGTTSNRPIAKISMEVFIEHSEGNRFLTEVDSLRIILAILWLELTDKNSVRFESEPEMIAYLVGKHHKIPWLNHDNFSNIFKLSEHSLGEAIIERDVKLLNK